MEAVLEADLLEVRPKTSKEYAALADKYLALIHNKQQQLEERQERITALRAETEAALDDIMRTLRIS